MFKFLVAFIMNFHLTRKKRTRKFISKAAWLSLPLLCKYAIKILVNIDVKCDWLCFAIAGQLYGCHLLECDIEYSKLKYATNL